MKIQTMTPRERFIAALERRPFKGRVPTFELVFFLTMEAFGKVHPSHRSYHQWHQMSETERQLHRNDMADIWIAIAERYQWSAIMFGAPPGELEDVCRMTDLLRKVDPGMKKVTQQGHISAIGHRRDEPVFSRT